VRRVVLWAVLAALPVAATAETFKVGDLGGVPSRRDCLAAAGEVLQKYIDEYGGGETTEDPAGPDAWAYYAWDLRPGENDVVIMCPAIADRVNAFYTIHSTGADSAANASAVAERLRELWQRPR